MKTTLISLSLGLCCLVAFQWIRESRLHGQLADMDVRLKSAEAEASDLKAKLHTWEGEITRLTEKAAAVVLSDSLQTEINRLTAELKKRDEELQAADTASPAAAALAKHHAEVKAQNEAILKQNTVLKKVAAERDSLAGKLNEQIRAWNELSGKYASLQKQRAP